MAHSQPTAKDLAASPAMVVVSQSLVDRWIAFARNLGQMLITVSLEPGLDADLAEACRTVYRRQLIAHGLTDGAPPAERWGIRHRSTRRWIAAHPRLGQLALDEDPLAATVFYSQWEADAWRETFVDFKEAYTVERIPQ